jgi:hypothetical protein
MNGCRVGYGSDRGGLAGAGSAGHGKHRGERLHRVAVGRGKDPHPTSEQYGWSEFIVKGVCRQLVR